MKARVLLPVSLPQGTSWHCCGRCRCVHGLVIPSMGELSDVFHINDCVVAYLRCSICQRIARRSSTGCVAREPLRSRTKACGFFPGVSTCSKPMFFLVTVANDAISAYSFTGDVIIWVTVSISGTATTSSTIAVLVGAPRWSVRLVGELAVYTQGETLVTYQDPCTMKLRQWGLQ